MSNVITGNPWLLDTAGVIKTKGNIVKVSKMVFYAAAAGDDVDVADAGGNTVFMAKAEIVNLITNETVFDQLISDLISAMLAVRLGHVYKLKKSDMNDVKEIYVFQKNEAEKAHAKEDLRTQNEP